MLTLGVRKKCLHHDLSDFQINMITAKKIIVQTICPERKQAIAVDKEMALKELPFTEEK